MLMEVSSLMCEPNFSLLISFPLIVSGVWQFFFEKSGIDCSLGINGTRAKCRISSRREAELAKGIGKTLREPFANQFHLPVGCGPTHRAQT